MIGASKLFTDGRNQIEAMRLTFSAGDTRGSARPEPQLRTDDRFFIIPLDSA
jgi:hypothetical protein